MNPISRKTRACTMEVLSELKIYGGNSNPPFVQIVEHQPGKLPFTWVPK